MHHSKSRRASQSRSVHQSSTQSQNQLLIVAEYPQPQPHAITTTTTTSYNNNKNDPCNIFSGSKSPPLPASCRRRLSRRPSNKNQIEETAKLITQTRPEQVAAAMTKPRCREQTLAISNTYSQPMSCPRPHYSMGAVIVVLLTVLWTPTLRVALCDKANENLSPPSSVSSSAAAAATQRPDAASAPDDTRRSSSGAASAAVNAASILGSGLMAKLIGGVGAASAAAAAATTNPGGQFGSRWVSLPTSSSGSAAMPSLSLPANGPNLRRPFFNHRDQSRLPGSHTQLLNRQSRLTRAVSRLRARIGARNSIRVHNAFRDFAWRILSTLSMPTPVIYELRRQNYYPDEENAANDRFHNRNTTKTIRSKRLIEPAQDWLQQRQVGKVSSRQLDEADDDDAPETFLERLRSRFEDYIKFSRQTFSRMARWPPRLPFKRQEAASAATNTAAAGDDDDDDDNEAAGSSTKMSVASAGNKPSGDATTASTTTKPTGKQKRRSRKQRLLSRRRRKEAERQMISINGKQYFVDDDGELKEMPPKKAKKA